MLSRWRKSVIFKTNCLLLCRYGSFIVVLGQGGCGGCPQMTSWGGRGGSCPLGCVGWVGRLLSGGVGRAVRPEQPPDLDFEGGPGIVPQSLTSVCYFL